MFAAEKLTPADAAIFETFVVPRYLTFFGELALEMLLSGDAARIVHLGCRTGYPDLKLYERIEQSEIVGLDASLPALELARNKAASRRGAAIEYRILENGLLADFEPAQFTHGLMLHPICDAERRVELFQDFFRLLCPGGQCLVAFPLRGSFQEVADLLREYALKVDDGEFSKAVEFALATRPSIESLSEELESVGFEDIDVEIRQTALAFDSGRAFVEDPVTRLQILPELRTWLGDHDLRRPLDYVRDAIDKYWSEAKLELSLNVGCASARVPA
ncbi:MAG TPA: class I SAM-dependent methyltransferase [Polyangiaceae bacterium]